MGGRVVFKVNDLYFVLISCATGALFSILEVCKLCLSLRMVSPEFSHLCH